MSSVLPFDIIALIIDNVEESNDTNLLNDLALVSHPLYNGFLDMLFSSSLICVTGRMQVKSIDNIL